MSGSHYSPAETCTRSSALAALRAFLPCAGHRYAEQRNFDLGAEGTSTTSRLSPAICRRLISEQEVLHATLEQHPPEVCFKFAQEVVWRTYWKGWLEWHPSVWAEFCRARDDVQAKVDLRLLERALAAGTGIAPFDHWRRQLADTGYLHNHCRLWFASIWIFTLKLPWQLGASLFMRELLDADAASNTLSWRWVAGLHTPGKHYVARADNIRKFTNGRFNPEGQLNELAQSLCEGGAPVRLPSLPEYSLTTLPRGKLGILMHAEDLSLEQTTLGALTNAGVALVPTVNEDRRSTEVAAFDERAVRDASERMSHHFGLPVHEVGDARALRAWSVDFDGIVVVEPWQGALRDRLMAWFGAMEVPVWLARRDYDLALVPRAQHGFFRFSADLRESLTALSGDGGPASLRFRRWVP